MYKKYILKPINGDSFEGIGFEGKRGKIDKYEYFPLLTPEEIKNCKIYLILKPLQFFYEVNTFSLPALSPEIVKLRLKDRINSLGFFTKPIEIFWKGLSKKDNLYQLCYLALESETIEKARLKLKEVAGAKLVCLSFLPITLAKGLPYNDEGLIVHKEQDSLWLVLVKDNLPFVVETSPIDEFLGINYNELLGRINFLKNLYYREYQREINNVFVTDKALAEGLSKQLEIKLIEEKYPEFWGVLYVDQEFNFIPEEERAVMEVLESNYKVSFLLFALSLPLLTLGITLNKINKSIEEEINRKESQIVENLNRFISEYPEEKLKAFRTYLEEKTQLESMIKPEEVLIYLVSATQGAYITNLEIKGGGNYTLSLTGEKKGRFEELTPFSQNLIKNLQNFIDIRENNIEYSVEEDKIIFHIKGNLRR
ncbi:MAG: hypothetical protein RMI63_08560 [Caldimicrobium sp.]|nr:hypothetical protein [Caldimicrobium sp.]